MNEEYENRYQVKCKRNNSYKILSEEGISEVVGLEVIAQQMGDLGDKVDFRLKAINKESEQMLTFLNSTFRKHEKTIRNLKYDFDEKEVLEVAKITRDGCRQYDEALFLLLTYFVKAQRKAVRESQQQEDKIVIFLQEKMERMIHILWKEYPPGSNLSKEDDIAKKYLK